MNAVSEIIVETENRIRRMEYTSEYSDEVKRAHTTGAMLTSDEHSEMSELEWKDVFCDKEEYIRWYFTYLSNSKKLDALGLVLDFCKRKKVKSVLSLGAGPGVLEYFLNEMTGINVIAADYDRFLCKKANDLLGSATRGFKSIEFDFYKDDLASIVKNNHVDLIVMFGSGCSMDDERYLHFLKTCRAIQVPNMLLFEAGVYKTHIYRKMWIHTFKHIIKQKVLGQYKLHKPIAIHAWGRSERNLHKIYNNSGFIWTRLPKLCNYSNSYLLELK